MSSRPDSGEVSSLDAWFTENARRILRLAYFYTRNEKLAEEIA